MLFSFMAMCFLMSADDKTEITADFIPRGITRRMGGYRPIQSQMDQEEGIVQVKPEELANPKYGYLTLDKTKWAYAIDEPEEGDAKLYIDSNRDGDLTNDPEVQWTAKPAGEYTMHDGSAKVQLENGELGQINMYRFDPKDARRPQLKNVLLFYPDFGYEYTIKLDDEEFKTATSGSLEDRFSLWLDRNNDGRPSRNYEMVTSDKPFNFTGTTYVISSENGKMFIEKSAEQIEQLPPPPDLRLGKQSLRFAAKTTEGEELQFPSSYAGKVVMLDFWATWCGPCIGEIPHMKEAYAEWHDKGFEILGINFDSENMEEKLADFLKDKELPWAQIYEGKGWETTIGQMHDVSGIPFVLLVDGDSGEILGTSSELRGPGLTKFIGQAIEKKAESSKK
jgi:thiol-disulfide isomerase/thioredoxin